MCAFPGGGWSEGRIFSRTSEIRFVIKQRESEGGEREGERILDWADGME